MFGFSLGDFGCVLDLNGGRQSGDRSFRQSVGQDAESAMIGRVRNADFFAFRIDVSVASDLVAESVAHISGRLAGMGVTEVGLAQLVLCVILAGRVRRIAVICWDGGRCGVDGSVGSCADSSHSASVWIVSSQSRISSTVSVEVKLGLDGQSQHDQQANNLKSINWDKNLSFFSKCWNSVTLTGDETGTIFWNNLPSISY